MVSTDLPFTYVAKGRYWRFRHPKTGDLALPGKPGDPAFHARYSELVCQVRATPKELPRSSFSWLIDRYLKSAEYRALSDPTQDDYARTLELIRKELGDEPFALTTRVMIKAVRDDYAATPRKAHKIKQMVSRLYSWADESDLVPEGFNPAKAIKRIKPKGGTREYVVWSDAEIEMFLGNCPAHVRTPFLIALYTGQRREDIVRMTWQQFQGDVVRVRQSKTRTLLDIPCHPVLRSHLSELKRRLDAGKRRAMVICTTADGVPFTVNGFSGALRRAVEAVEGMPRNRSIHGVRYAAGSRMDEGGATVSEIEAVLGHQTFKMAIKYASQRLRAKAGIEAMEGSNNA